MLKRHVCNSKETNLLPLQLNELNFIPEEQPMFRKKLSYKDSNFLVP